MRKIKDRIMLGAITGLAASIPIQMFEVYLHKQGVTDVPYALSASRIFLTKKKSKTPGGKAISVVINFINAGLTASSIVYTLSLTGKDKALVKGAGIGTLMWVGIAGLVSNLGLNIKSKKPSTPLINLTEHIVFGTMCSYLITTFGDDSLFPDSSVGQQEEIPVVNS